MEPSWLETWIDPGFYPLPGPPHEPALAPGVSPVDRVARAPPDVPIIGWVTAYVDESLRLTGEGLYVLAAVVVPDPRAPEVRAALRAAVPPGLRRYHWRRESEASRAAIVEVVRSLRVSAVVVTAPVGRTRQERARRRCLRRLVWELAQRDVRRAVLESRDHADAADRALLAFALRAGWGPPDFEYRFGLPTDEPLLWLADIVAGAVGHAMVECDQRYLGPLSPATEVVPAS